MTINTVSTNSLSAASAETKNLQTQLTGKQQSLNKLTSDAEMTASDKEQERRKINREIAELNRKLRQEQLKEQEDNKKLQKEQEKKKVIKEELLERMNPKQDEDSDISSGTKDQQEDKPAYSDMPVVTLKNALSADTAIQLSNIEEQVSRNMDNRQDVLASEIHSDELYGMDTTAKREELSNMRRKEPFQIDSLHKKEDTSMHSMDLNTKIIIRE